MLRYFNPFSLIGGSLNVQKNYCQFNSHSFLKLPQLQNTFERKKNALVEDDDTEIVIVSDTVRQRRARTPIKTSTCVESRVTDSALPDLLPKTFHLAESSSLFSRVSGDETQVREMLANGSQNGIRKNVQHKISVVEIKEGHLELLQNVEVDPNENVEDSESVAKIVDTINIFESCNNFEPEFVETIHIIDASSDTSTTSTPQLLRRSGNYKSADELKTELQRELENVAIFTNLDEHKDHKISVKKQRISFDGKASMEKERDLMKDSEEEKDSKINLLKLRPTLKELWMAERNSFYSADNDNDDEPLEFSEDEEIPRYSIEMATDSDSDVVEFFDPF